MIAFITGIVVTFITLNLAAVFTGFKKDMKVFLMASFTYGILVLIPIPIPIIGSFVPVVGMYMVLVGTDYESHDRVFKLCLVNWLLNLILVFFLVAKDAV